MDEAPFCTICQEFLSGEHVDKGCGHVFHAECAQSWFKDNPDCPNCRAPVCGECGSSIRFKGQQHFLNCGHSVHTGCAIALWRQGQTCARCLDERESPSLSLPVLPPPPPQPAPPVPDEGQVVGATDSDVEIDVVLLIVPEGLPPPSPFSPFPPFFPFTPSSLTPDGPVPTTPLENEDQLNDGTPEGLPPTTPLHDDNQETDSEIDFMQ